MEKYLIGLILMPLAIITMEQKIYLPLAPKKIEQFNEIATRYCTQLPDLFNDLTSQERVVIYFLHRAMLPGNRINVDQTHRYGLDVLDIFETIYEKRSQVQEVMGNSADQFIKEVEIFLVSLWTNNGQYCASESTNEKRTPSALGLTLITPENLQNVLAKLGWQDVQEVVSTLERTIFDETFEPTRCLKNDVKDPIAASAINFYAADFTQKDFESLPKEHREKLNAYFYVKEENGERIPVMESLCIGGKYSKELEVSEYWLKKALEHARKFPEQFDKHWIISLEKLIVFINTGDEQDFKEHSKEWLQTKSRIDYTYGWIETYLDPKNKRGRFQSEVTIKTVDMSTLNKVLPLLEKELPFPPEQKREGLGTTASLPNASVNTIAWSGGDLGPLCLVAAYCLPNYPEMRKTDGSKQIMYQSAKSIGKILNPELAHLLFNSKEQREWLAKNDPEDKLAGKVWDWQCTLHETLGHGSGNNKKLTTKYADAIEELRAEIIALYSSIAGFDLLAENGFFEGWEEKIEKEDLKRQFLRKMALAGLNRLRNLPKDAKEVTGAHARANTAILNYLLDHGDVKVVREVVEYQGKQYTVLDIAINDMVRATAAVTQLAQCTQSIKSNGDDEDAERLLEQYGVKVRNPEWIKIVKDNRAAVMGTLKQVARIYPDFQPETNQEGEVVDVKGAWPASFAEQNMKYRQMAMSKK